MGDYYLDRFDAVRVSFSKVEAETDEAYGVSLSLGDDRRGDGELVWLPKSQVEHLDENEGEAWLPRWLAEEKELEYE